MLRTAERKGIKTESWTVQTSVQHYESGFCFKFQETQLTEALLERNSRRRQKEQVQEERENLIAQIDLMKRSVASLFTHQTFCKSTHQCA